VVDYLVPLALGEVELVLDRGDRDDGLRSPDLLDRDRREPDVLDPPRVDELL
jgi:hypothetical protein